jgi:hypothetical protein
MWSDNDIDNAFRRLDPTEPEPTPFPLDAWLKLEAGLDQAVIDRAVRRRLWQFFAAEVAVVALVGLGWSLWPAGKATPVSTKAQTEATTAQPLRKAADEKRRQIAEAASAHVPAVSIRPANTWNEVSAAPRPASAPATTAPTPSGPAEVAATYAAIPMRLQPESQRQMPLAAVRATQPHALLLNHPSPGEHRAIMRKNKAAVLAETDRRPPSIAGARQAQATATTTEVVVATRKHDYAELPVLPSDHRSTSRAARTADGATAAPTRAAGEVAVADAASQNAAMASGGAPVAHQSLAAKQEALDSATQPGYEGGVASIAALMAEPDQPTTSALPAALATVASPLLPLPAVVHQPRIYVGLVAAPDVSTVKFVDVQAPRLNVGLTLEYRLGQRWRVATGVQRSTKAYYARREDYDWTNYPRAQTRDFSWVDGECTVLDVPLNLRYDAVVQGHGRWFGTAGLSSFFMQRENYSYDYEDGGTYKNWQLPGLVNVNRHLFSVLNLSAGYEYSLGAHWRLQAEPYAKVPLAGVGAGKVKLLSGGVYFGLKYGF